MEQVKMDIAASFNEIAHELGDITINGIREVGLAAGAEKVRVPAECLCIGSTPAVAGYSAWLGARDLGSEHPGVLASLVGAAIQIVANAWFDNECYTNAAVLGNDSKENRAAFAEYLKKMSPSDQERGVLILAATKVNWWQTNHHVGQARFQGYIKKVVTAQFGVAAAAHDGVYNAVWRLGHWASTRGVLASLGIRGCGPKMRSFPAPTEDISIRIRAYPAGTAKVGVAIAIFKRIYHGMFGKVLPPSPNIGELMESSVNILSRPVEFHVGASHLTGGNGREIVDVSEDIMRYCAAYVHALAAKSTLAGAAVLPSADSVKDHEVTTVINSIQLTLAKTGMNMEDRLKIIEQGAAAKDSIVASIDALPDIAKRAITGSGPVVSRNMPDDTDMELSMIEGAMDEDDAQMQKDIEEAARVAEYTRIAALQAKEFARIEGIRLAEEKANDDARALAAAEEERNREQLRIAQEKVKSYAAALAATKTPKKVAEVKYLVGKSYADFSAEAKRIREGNAKNRDKKIAYAGLTEEAKKYGIIWPAKQ